MLKKILFSPDPGDGGNPSDATPAPGAPTSNPTPPPDSPPAAGTVLSGTRSERELQLEEENRRLAEEKKNREVRISELEDENHRLKEVPPDPARAGQLQAEEEDWRLFKL